MHLWNDTNFTEESAAAVGWQSIHLSVKCGSNHENYFKVCQQWKNDFR